MGTQDRVLFQSALSRCSSAQISHWKGSVVQRQKDSCNVLGKPWHTLSSCGFSIAKHSKPIALPNDSNSGKYKALSGVMFEYNSILHDDTAVANCRQKKR